MHKIFYVTTDWESLVVGNNKGFDILENHIEHQLTSF